MFNSKQTNLFGSKPTQTSAFIKTSRSLSSATNSLGNGALKYTTTGNDFVDQFGKATNYRAARSFSDISVDMATLWSHDKEMTVKFVLYLRTITRIVQFPDGTRTENPQRGQGLKHEGIFRMIWLNLNANDVFWKNIDLFISAGSWKDVFVMLQYDLVYNGWENRQLDWDKFFALIAAGLENTSTQNLVKKYLPQIKSNSVCNTVESQADNMIGKWLCGRLVGKGNYKLYRKLKTSGTAHEWQKVISQGKWLELDFNTIHGRALAKLVSGKFLKNVGLEEKYQSWISSKPTAKYTGYVYELFTPLGTAAKMRFGHLPKYQIDTMNAQFLELVEKAKVAGKDNGLIGVLDTSGSMASQVPGTKVSAYSVGKSLTLFMSYLLGGRFAGNYFEFSDKTILKQWKGSTPVEQLCNDNSSIIAGTNFISIADHFGQILKSGVNESDFPTGIVCFSDGCFNSVETNTTNFDKFKFKLKQFGFSDEFVNNFKVILWDIPNNHYGEKPQTAFESVANTPNLFHISGLDGSALAFLTGKEMKNSESLFETAMDQELLNKVEI